MAVAKVAALFVALGTVLGFWHEQIPATHGVLPRAQWCDDGGRHLGGSGSRGGPADTGGQPTLEDSSLISDGTS